MARYRDPRCRQCRREGMKLFLKGPRCNMAKCAVERRGYPPGQHGQGRIRLSDYGVQLREKQKLKRMYGLFERPFRVVFQRAQRTTGVTGEKLLELLERRLDNVVYRLGWGSSRADARQMVRHRHIRVNGRVVYTPSFTVRVGDIISTHEHEAIATMVAQNLEMTKDRERASWIDSAEGSTTGTITRLPSKADITVPIQEQLIVELYSR